MTTTAIAVRPANRPPVDVLIPRPVRRGPRVKRDPTPVQLRLIDAGEHIITAVIQNPIMAMIGGCVVVEVCQMIKPNGRTPLLSSFLGGAIETIIVSQGALSAVGDAVGKLNLLKLP